MAKEVKVKMKNGTEKHSEFKSFISVTKMQLKNKVDLSWTKSVKSVIRVVILTLLKSIIVGALAFVMLYILNLLGIYRAWNIYQVVIVILSLSLILSLISCTFGLTKNLYFSDDNKVIENLGIDNISQISKDAAIAKANADKDKFMVNLFSAMNSK